MIPFSILDLSPIPQGATASDALRNSLDLAQHAESWGYNRYWLAEHHNMPGIASAATAVVIGYIAGGTKTIRVGSGGIMLPNHSPLVIAEQFGTLASLYTGRIELGLGRAPGTDMPTARALRRDLVSTAENFPQSVQELISYFEAAAPGQEIRAVPGAGLRVPIWLLGSSLFSAQLAAMLGLPFAFASHFAPADMMEALHLYRSRFKPSRQLDRPYAMLGLNAVVAKTDAEAQRHFTSLLQSFTNLRRGRPGQVPPPIDDIDAFWSPAEKASAGMTLLVSVVGSPETVERGLLKFMDVTQPDEIIATAHIYDHAARLRSFELLVGVHSSLAVANPVRASEKLLRPRQAALRSNDADLPVVGDSAGFDYASDMDPIIKGAIPVLPAADTTKSLYWWTEVCGFKETFRDATPPTYVGINRGEAYLHIAGMSDKELARKVGDQTMVRLAVKAIEALYSEFQQRGGKVHPNGPLQTKPWGTKEFGAIDPNGVCVTFQE